MMIDMPPLPAQEVGIVQLAEAGKSTPFIIAQAEKLRKNQPGPFYDYVVKNCQEVEHASIQGDNGNVLGPQYALARLLKLKDEALDSLAKLEISPEHGQLRRIAYTRREQFPRSQTSWTTVYANPDGRLPAAPPDTDTVKHFVPVGGQYRYITTPGFYGKDRAVFSVKYKAKRYRIDLEIRIYNFVPQASEGIGCPAPRLIKAIPKYLGAGSENIPVDTSSAESNDFWDTSAEENNKKCVQIQQNRGQAQTYFPDRLKGSN